MGNPLDLTRSSYMKCVWPGCDGGACTVKSTEHARGVPTMFYVFCPECGAHGPECCEKSEAARRWQDMSASTDAADEAEYSGLSTETFSEAERILRGVYDTMLHDGAMKDGPLSRSENLRSGRIGGTG